MEDRHSDGSRRVMGLAQRHATQLQHGWIGSVHLLLALLEEPRGLAGRVLRDSGLALELTTQAVRALTPPEGAVPAGQLPFTADAQQVVEGALTIAGDERIATEHLLLSLLADTSSAANNVLTALGADPRALKDAVIERVESGPARLAGPAAGTDPDAVGSAALASLSAARSLVHLLAAERPELQPVATGLDEALATLERALAD